MSLPETFVKGFHDESEVKKMKYLPLGGTGMNISQLSLGTATFSYFYGDYNEEECKRTVHDAIKKGINYIDTAPYYGHGTAEEILGKCLEGIPRQAYYLATKVARYEKDPKLMFDFSAEKTRQSIEQSLKRMEVDYIDLIQVHDIDFAPSLDIVLKETLPTLHEFVKAGKAKYIGITGYTCSTLLECIEKSTVPISTILNYARLTMIDDTLKEFIPKFQMKNVGILNAAVHAQGLLTNAGPSDWQAACKEIKDACTQARQHCIEKGVELGKLALYHSLQQQGPASVLVGMKDRQILDYNLKVVHDGLTSDEQAAYNHVMKIFDKLTVKHWGTTEIENYWKAVSA
ncbi:unnamed protein product [Callosobruchus maculatus]|uniref:NADP-dependent oxidoreductase domain-containing protein n=2 Tax=Callosobruchus maculatus TaxID=64391 RepID=A0A653DDE2_CALMS|nr:unnamed protein product [Callosobruchus maculatus]